MQKGSAELPLPDGDFTAKRRAAVGRIDLMKKGLRRSRSSLQSDVPSRLEGCVLSVNLHEIQL